MRMDGEPWKQPLPTKDENESVVIEISRFGQVSMLATGENPSKSVNDPLTPRTPSKDSEYDSDEEDLEEIPEDRKKLGAAASFKLPQDFNLSQVS